MITRKNPRKSFVICTILSILSSTLCHMEMSWPYPLRSKYDPNNSYAEIDYSMTSPLQADGSDFPCKGYQNDRPVQITANYQAGSIYNMTLAGTATHDGGSCQISLSYDNGATFRVIRSIIGGCPLVSTYDFTIPSDAPAGGALLAWTWQNLVGNREYYMNCAEVAITSHQTRRRRRQSYSTFDDLPYLWKTNLAGLNDCSTAEGVNVVYPNPGPDVLYGNGTSSSDPATQGDCDNPTPYGLTYKDLGDSSIPPPVMVQLNNSNTTSSAPTPNAATSPRETGASDSAMVSSTPQTISFASLQARVGATSSSLESSPPPNTHSTTTTTVTMECAEYTFVEETVTMTVYPSSSAPPSPTHTFHPLTFSTLRTSTSTSTRHTTPTTHHTTTTSTHVLASSSAPQPPPSQPSNHPPYLQTQSNANRHLPCPPGLFICLSPTTFLTCDYNDGSVPSQPPQSYVYDYPRPVAAGMMCLPFLSPYTSATGGYEPQAGVRQGFYRDDRIVRSRPEGDCAFDGAIRCVDGGEGFEVCDMGGWVGMGSVAAGTRCVGGRIVGG